MDDAIKTLKLSHEILQYLSPWPTVKHHDPPVPDAVRPTKVQKVGDAKGEKGKGKGKQKISIPDGCATHDNDGKPFVLQVSNWEVFIQRPAGKATSATNKGAFGCDPSFSAIIQTEVMVGVAVFHLIQLRLEEIHHLSRMQQCFIW